METIAEKLVRLRNETIKGLKMKDHIKDGMISYELEINHYISMVDWVYNFMQEYEITTPREIINLFLSDLKEQKKRDEAFYFYNAEQVNLLFLVIGLVGRGRREGISINSYDAFKEVILGDIKECFEKIEVTEDGMCKRSQTAGEKGKLTREYIRRGSGFMSAHLMNRVIKLEEKCD